MRTFFGIFSCYLVGVGAVAKVVPVVAVAVVEAVAAEHLFLSYEKRMNIVGLTKKYE